MTPREWEVSLNGEAQFTYIEWTDAVRRRVFDLKRQGCVTIASWGRKE